MITIDTAATEVAGIRAVITADISQYTAGVEQAKKKASELGHSAHQAEASFMGLNMALKDVGASSAQITRINDALRRSNPELLRKQIAAVTDEMRKLGASSAEIDKVAKEIEKNALSTHRTANEVKALGAAYIGLAVAMAAIITKSVQTAASFEQAMAKVKAITQATGAEFERLREQAIQLGASTVFSASQAADAQALLAQAGFKTNDVMTALPGVLSLAAAGQMDLATTASIAASVLNGFRLETEETGRVVDVLAKASIDSNADITDLGMAMKYVAPVAANMGLSVEEATASVEALSNAGIRGEQAGTSLRAILLQLASPSEEAAFYMDKLGVSIQDSAGNVLPFAQIIGQMQGAFARLTQAQQADVAATLVGQEAASGFLTLISNGQSTLESYTASLRNAGGTAEQVAGTQMDTLKGAINEMQSALESAGITVGDKFAPAVRLVAEQLTGLINGFTNLNTPMQGAIIAFTTVTPLVAGAAAGIVALKVALDAIKASSVAAAAGMTAFTASIPIIGAISIAIGALATAAAALAGKYAETKKAAEDFAAAQTSLNDALSKSPLTRTTGDLEDLRGRIEETTQALRDREAIERRIANLKGGNTGKDWRAGAAELSKLNDELDAADKRLRDLGYASGEDAAGGIAKMNKAINDSVPALLQEERANLQAAAASNERLTSIESNIATYKKLSNAQKLDVGQKEQLQAATAALIKQYPGLHTVMDEEGNKRITNISLAETQANAERSLLDGTLKVEKARIEQMERTTKAQKAAIEAQIANYQALLKTMNAVISASGSSALTDPDSLASEKVYARGQQRLNALYPEQNQVQSALNELEAQKSALTSGNLDAFSGRTTGSGVDLSKPKKQRTTKPKTGKTPEELAAEARKAAYEADLKTVQFQSEFYDLSADAQIKKYEELRKKHAQFLKESVDDARTLTLQIKKLQEDSVQSRYDFSAKWIEAEENRMEDSGKTELQIAQTKLASWTRLRDRYKKDSDQYKAADEKVRESRKAVADAQEKEAQTQYEASAKWIDAEERRMSAAGKSEAEIAQMKITTWTRVRDRYSKDSEHYAQADEELYAARKDLTEKTVELAESLLDAEKEAIEKAKKADLDAIEARKDAYVAEQKAKIDAIDDLLAKEAELNSDADYETQLAEKNARIAELASAVGPEGIAEREQAIKDRDKLVLDHERDLRKRELESQKSALEKERDAQEAAFDKEKTEKEAQYDALLQSFESYSGDIKTVEAGIAAFRVSSAAGANAEILSELDTFVTEYNAKMASVTAARAEAQEALDLAEYNANKDAYNAAKARGDKAEMERLAARNKELRIKYGVTQDTGEKLQHFADGGVVQGAYGSAVPVIAHAGEIVLNPQQQAALFDVLSGHATRLASREPAAPTYITQNIDLGVDEVTLADKADIATFYDERTRALSRIQSAGVKIG
ncbi:phage tail tape measure protein [Paenibacillus sp. 7124]|uniref:Phage tail tape measure protein n=1 Tax=Paenibacillus apii TaxID=1850370 RepID=A0A6M1PD62_9BACL|nr:phage tail tape measure protein [Paenibacillus apii]NGM81190.1 phage tail tape measure protein [Paenibacillus apii]